MSGRQFFQESEKSCLQELIIKYKLNSKATIQCGNPALKKNAWARLVNDFNSIETNTRRTEAQLKKCWDNMKTRHKHALALEKRERMKTGGGPYHPQPSSSQEMIDGALLEATDVELQFAIDSDNISELESGNLEGNRIIEGTAQELPLVEAGMSSSLRAVEESTGQPAIVQSRRPVLSQETISTVGTQADFQGRETGPPRTPPVLRNSEYDGTTSHASGARNIRSQVIMDEFIMRQQNYKKAQERDEELQKMKVKEMEWKIKTAEQQFLTASIERQSAEELLRCNRAKREAAEAALLNLK